MRKPVIIGNWKMNKSLDDAKLLIKNISSENLDIKKLI